MGRARSGARDTSENWRTRRRRSLCPPAHAHAHQSRGPAVTVSISRLVKPRLGGDTVSEAAEEPGNGVFRGWHLAEHLALASRVGDVLAGLEPLDHRV
jgi:hypothetical protein